MPSHRQVATELLLDDAQVLAAIAPQVQSGDGKQDDSAADSSNLDIAGKDALPPLQHEGGGDAADAKSNAPAAAVAGAAAAAAAAATSSSSASASATGASSSTSSKRVPKLSAQETDESKGVQSSDVCYVIYTSGTTGVPKGWSVGRLVAFLFFFFFFF